MRWDAEKESAGEKMGTRHGGVGLGGGTESFEIGGHTTSHLRHNFQWTTLISGSWGVERENPYFFM